MLEVRCISQGLGVDVDVRKGSLESGVWVV